MEKKVNKTNNNHRENICGNLVVHHLEGEWTLSIAIDLCKNFRTNETHTKSIHCCQRLAILGFDDVNSRIFLVINHCEI